MADTEWAWFRPVRPSQKVTATETSPPLIRDATAQKSTSVEPDNHAAGDEAGLQALFEFDPSTCACAWSDPEAARRLFGVELAGPNASAIGFDSFIRDREAAAKRRMLCDTQSSFTLEYEIARPDADSIWVEERSGWIGAGASKRLIGLVRSIEAQKQREGRLAWLARYDELTGVLNRSELRRVLQLAFDEAGANLQGAYILAGIDDLGSVNADFGFDVADEVIAEVGARLKRMLKPGDAIGRIAGTKFGILLREAPQESIRDTCIQYLNAVRESVIDTRRGAVAASICLGAIALPDDAADAHLAMARAEASLDQAKRIGRSSWSPFSEKTDVVSARRRNTHMSDVILTALNERRVRLAFQPIVSDIGEAPTKFECLIRMRAEDGREVPAPEFIPVAERLGLVHFLDRRVLELAINTLAVCPNIKLNVNISMETVKDPLWAEGYLSVLRSNEALARRITVELTETQVIDAVDASIEFVTTVKKLGASFAIDDFGAGYTSFRNLKALDIDTLKIDGSFVTGVSASRENQLFVRTLLDLARNFGMRTVAEWVDNEADAMLLKGLGVDFLQGYLIGKPETTPAWLPNGAPNAAPLSPPGQPYR